MKRSIGLSAGLAVVMMAGGVAHAHQLSCQKTVNGSSAFSVTSYPTTLHYAITVINELQGAPSQALCVRDPLLEGLGFSFTPAPPFTLDPGCSVTDTFDVKIRSEADCLWLAAQDGTADRYIHNTVTVKWDSGHAQCSAKVYCAPEDKPQSGATRTLGFFKTHEEALSACLAQGDIDLGFVTVDSLEEALGLLWAQPSRYESGAPRSELDRARFLLGRQTLVAICNNRLFGSSPGGGLIDESVETLAGTDCARMLELEALITAFNESGDDESFPSGFAPGPATPRHAQSIADDPTGPSGESCSSGG